MIWSGWQMPAVGERVFVERDIRQTSMLELHGDSVRIFAYRF
jgi:hypothetical protein